jgi:hypothetical protein
MSLLTRDKGPDVGPHDKDLPKEFMWLADAPLFIDERRVDAFYDAVFRPDYGETTRTLERGRLGVAPATGVVSSAGELRVRLHDFYGGGGAR